MANTVARAVLAISYDETKPAAAPATPSAAPAAAAPACVASSNDEVQVTGARTREERDAELRKRAIDVEQQAAPISSRAAAKMPKVEHKQ